MPIKLSLEEKLWLVAMFGDISDFNRDRWLRFESADPSPETMFEKIAEVFTSP